MREPIVIGHKMMPKVDPVDPCPCQFKPVRLTYKKAQIFWQVEEGERVRKDQVVCEGEVEKKVLEFVSPCDGVLQEIVIEDGEEAGEGDILGYIEEEVMNLDEAFATRPDRFRLLERGNEECGWQEPMTLLEVGCSIGDASAYMSIEKGHHITAIDRSEELIQRAIELHQNDKTQKDLVYCVEDATNMTFADAMFDGIYSEAAFSPIPQKEEILREYIRVLKPGGRYLLNDFAIRSQVSGQKRNEVSHIPCFAGVGTIEEYRELFEKMGFTVIRMREDYSELIRVSSWLAKVYHIGPLKVGGYLSGYYRSGASDDCVICDGGKDQKDDFFTRARLTYYQIILEKKRC